MLRQMLTKDASRRSSSFQLLSTFRSKFSDLSDSANAPPVKYSPAKTISKIELTVENSQQDSSHPARHRKYSPDMNLSNRGKIK